MISSANKRFFREFIYNYLLCYFAVADVIGEAIGEADAPAGLALSGEWLLATHFYSGAVTALNVLRTPVVVGSVNAEPEGNLASVIAIEPEGRLAYIPQTRTGLALVSLQYMQDWFPVVLRSLLLQLYLVLLLLLSFRFSTTTSFQEKMH